MTILSAFPTNEPGHPWLELDRISPGRSRIGVLLRSISRFSKGRKPCICYAIKGRAFLLLYLSPVLLCCVADQELYVYKWCEKLLPFKPLLSVSTSPPFLSARHTTNSHPPSLLSCPMPNLTCSIFLPLHSLQPSRPNLKVQLSLLKSPFFAPLPLASFISYGNHCVPRLAVMSRVPSHGAGVPTAQIDSTKSFSLLSALRCARKE